MEIPPDAAEDPGEEGEFRLTDGVWPDEGRAEVFHAGRWGTVCSDRISKPTVTTWEYDTAGNLVLNNDGAPNEMEVGNMAAARICAAMGDYDTGKYVSGYGQSGEEHQPYDYWPANSSYPLDGRSRSGSTTWCAWRAAPDVGGPTECAGYGFAGSHVQLRGLGSAQLHPCGRMRGCAARTPVR